MRPIYVREFMDHIVFVSRVRRELDRLLAGDRTMIVRGSLGKRMPYGRVSPGDTLFFAAGSSRITVRAIAAVQNVLDTPRLAGAEASRLLEQHGAGLQLSDAEADRWSRQKYLTLIEIADLSPVVPFSIAARGSGEADDWLAVDDIDEVIE